MFTGIITDIGSVKSIEQRGDTRFVIRTRYDMDGVDIGASICCSGACLTVIEKGKDGTADWFAVDVSAETLSKTTLGDWRAETPINLERALKVGDELGGHIVSGHVDGVGTVVDSTPEGDSVRWVFDVPDEIAPFVAPKGSVAINGVSLTVNEVEGNRFGVNIIPHTAEHTTFGTLAVGDKVNLEVDPLARYVARLLEMKG
ncbi:riboflavin synthase [Hwanghaeella grinnelliae]|uniref:Riboflavin synthase n=1 Tax=Hwanghaeella grinnelliae TaxID=2500179 RepID=A0A3S2W7K1_9PROT|nr:riboflavin synthase [Hwanghaeella grinnelliae]RVU39208.1 riboflavin synthase [Hwanghaeella grinnelliae]